MLSNYRLSMTGIDTSGARLMQEAYLDESGQVSLTEIGSSVARAKKWLSYDNSALLFERVSLPSSTLAYQLWVPYGGHVSMQAYADSQWTAKTFTSYPLYSSPATLPNQQFLTAGGAHYHQANYSTTTYVMKTTDLGETYTQSAAINTYPARGLIVPADDWIVLYSNNESGWQGLKISTNDGVSFTDYVTGMRFDNIVQWGTDLIGFYGNRIFRSTDNGWNWNVSVAYATSGYAVTAPAAADSNFKIEDIFVYDDELHVITSYATIDYAFYMRCVKFSEPLTADAEGTEVSIFRNPQYEWGEWDVAPWLRVLVKSPTGVISIFTDPWENLPFMVDWINGQQMVMWNGATDITPSVGVAAWYDRQSNKFLYYYVDVQWVYGIVGYEYEWNPDTEEYDIEVPIYDYYEEEVADVTASWTPGATEITFGSTHQTGMNFNTWAAIVNKP